MTYRNLRNVKEENSDKSNMLITLNTEDPNEAIDNFDGLLDKQNLGQHEIIKPYYVIFKHSNVLLEKLLQALEKVQREKKWVVV